MTRIKGKGMIRGIKEKGSYVEKWMRRNGEVRYFYNGYVLVCVPEGEIERARREIRDFEEGMMGSARRMMDEAEGIEKDDPMKALYAYEEALQMLEDVSLPEAEGLKRKCRARISYLEKYKDPFIELMGLEGNGKIIKALRIVDIHQRDAGRFLELGGYYRVYIQLERNSFVYIFDFNKEKGEISLIFPNEYDEKNYIKEGFYPSGDVYFEAREPAGLNTLILIATDKKIPIPYGVLQKPRISDFLSRISKTDYDAKRLDFYIKR